LYIRFIKVICLIGAFVNDEGKVFYFRDWKMGSLDQNITLKEEINTIIDFFMHLYNTRPPQAILVSVQPVFIRPYLIKIILWYTTVQMNIKM
jgi:hypothetical protein